MNPLLHLLANQPQLLADHAQAYVELAAAEMARLTADCKQRALLAALALCGLTVAGTLVGMALMLWSVTLAPQAPSHLVLIATPAVPALMAACCLAALHLRRARDSAAAMRQQIQIDLQIWRTAA